MNNVSIINNCGKIEKYRLHDNALSEPGSMSIFTNKGMVCVPPPIDKIFQHYCLGKSKYSRRLWRKAAKNFRARAIKFNKALDSAQVITESAKRVTDLGYINYKLDIQWLKNAAIPLFAHYCRRRKSRKMIYG